MINPTPVENGTEAVTADPELAVEIALNEAKLLRAQVEMAQATLTELEQDARLRDLSPLGR